MIGVSGSAASTSTGATGGAGTGPGSLVPKELNAAPAGYLSFGPECCALNR